MASVMTVLRLGLLAVIAFAGYTYLTSQGGEQVVSNKICYTIEGYRGCGFFERAKAQGLKLSESDKFKINIRESPQRSEYVGERLPELNKVVKGAGTHRTSPFVFSGCGENDKVYVGGATEFIAHVKEAHPEMG